MYKGKTVLITGGSRGIGAMLVYYFAQNNARVIAISREAGEYHYDNVKYITSDLSDPKQITQAFEWLLKERIVVDILINNAAVLTSHYAVRIPEEDIIKMVQVDLLAHILVTRECLKLMNNEWGRIINISSMAVSLEPKGDSVYAACKAGLTTWHNILAKEVAFRNITCNTVGISAIETDMLRQLNKEKIDKVVAALPLSRYATVEDITNVVDFFCSEKSDYITAQTIYLGGVH